MNIIEEFYKEFGGLEFRIRMSGHKYVVECWPEKCCKNGCIDCNKARASSKDKSLNKAILKTMTKVVDEQAMQYEEIEDVKKRLKASIE